MSLAFIAQSGTVQSGRTTIDLDGSAVTSPVTHRTHQTALSAGDLVDGEYYRWTVHKSDGNSATITGQYNDDTTDYIGSITWEDEIGTISATDTVDVILIGYAGFEFISIAVSDEETDLVADTGVVTFRMPYAFTVFDVRASVVTAPTGQPLQVDINEGGSSILSTVLSIDATEKTSTTAATPAVISDSALADDAEITIDIDQIGSTVAGAGLKVTLIGRRSN